MGQLDSLDWKIVNELQEDASLSAAEIGERVGLSANACWRRIKQLESSGVIEKRVALLDPDTVGLGLTVFVLLRTSEHNQEWLDRFASNVRNIPEVVEFYRMSGDVDYLIKILVPDVRGYDRVYKKLIQSAPLTDVSASFAMERIKFTTAVPTPV